MLQSLGTLVSLIVPTTTSLVSSMTKLLIDISFIWVDMLAGYDEEPNTTAMVTPEPLYAARW